VNIIEGDEMEKNTVSTLISKVGRLFGSAETQNIIGERPFEIMKALGGAENIAEVDSCISRLRVALRDPTRVKEEQLKILGAAGTVKSGNNLQIVFGTESEHIMDEIVKYMSQTKPTTSIRQKLILKAPLTGKLLPLSAVPDQVFSQKIMGDGFAIEPTEGLVLSPTDATVVQIFRTNHAIGLETENGVEILIHIGIDTVKLAGKGFKALVQNGQRVKAGQPLIEFDLQYVKDSAPSIISPVVFTNMERIASIEAKSKGDTVAGEEIASLELQV
jgi:glucose-specific phosphotransferase system IIA component